jgi:carbon monoxide dehydrogenase subunit G
MKSIHLAGSYIIRAPRHRVYEVLTDFESAPRHFPRVAKSARVLRRDGDDLEVEVETKAFLGSRTFRVHMETHLRPDRGFTSTNTSSVGVEHEVVTLEDVPEGTRFVYVNDMDVTSRIFRLLGGFLIRTVALRYWERAYIGRLREMLEDPDG